MQRSDRMCGMLFGTVLQTLVGVAVALLLPTRVGVADPLTGADVNSSKAESKSGDGQPKHADAAPSCDDCNVYVRHLPIAEAIRNKNVEISVEVTNDWEMETLVLVYRKIGAGKFKKVAFALSSSGAYVAVVKGEDVSWPGFEYAVWVKEKGRKGRFAFASGKDPHPVVVHKLNWKERREIRLLMNRGTTSTFFADYSYTWFGSQQDVHPVTGDAMASALDQFHRAEFGYSYRILTVLYAFHFGVGIVRGTTLKAGEKQWVGIDYGFSKILFEFHPLIALEPKIVFGGSEEGLEAGGGATLRIGNTLSTHVDIGFEMITTVGSTVFLKLLWDTVPGFMMGLCAELTDFPSSQAWGTRIYYEASFIGYKYLFVKGTVGYASRSSTKGGVIAGLALNVNF